MMEHKVSSTHIATVICVTLSAGIFLFAFSLIFFGILRFQTNILMGLITLSVALMQLSLAGWLIRAVYCVLYKPDAQHNNSETYYTPKVKAVNVIIDISVRHKQPNDSTQSENNAKDKLNHDLIIKGSNKRVNQNRREPLKRLFINLTPLYPPSLVREGGQGG
jgi:hypothetical protein